MTDLSQKIKTVIEEGIERFIREISKRMKIDYSDLKEVYKKKDRETLKVSKPAKKIIPKIGKDFNINVSSPKNLDKIITVAGETKFFWHERTGFVFNNKDELAVFCKFSNGHIEPLTEKDIGLCKKYDFSFILDKDLSNVTLAFRSFGKEQDLQKMDLTNRIILKSLGLE